MNVQSSAWEVGALKENETSFFVRDKKIQVGEIILKNDQDYPFNNSTQTVALKNTMKNKNYWIYTELMKSNGPIGQVKTFDKLLNGFKISYSGSATLAKFRYIVMEGEACNDNNS